MMVVGYWTSGILRVASCSSESDQNNTVELRGKKNLSVCSKKGPKNGRREHTARNPQQYRTYNGKFNDHELTLHLGCCQSLVAEAKQQD